MGSWLSGALMKRCVMRNGLVMLALLTLLAACQWQSDAPGKSPSENVPRQLTATIVSGYAITAIAQDGQRWVAVGTGGAIVTSENGRDWTQVAEGGTNADLKAIAQDGKRWVAVGADGAIVTSENGRDWTLVGKGVTYANLTAIAQDGKRWVAVGSDGAILTSENGHDWMLGKGVTGADLEAIAHDGRRWVAVGDRGTIVESGNGRDWTLVAEGMTNADLRKIAQDGKVAIGDEAIVVLKEGPELPRISRVDFAFGPFGMDATVGVAGPRDLCPNNQVEVVFRSQTEFNYRKKQTPLEEIASVSTVLDGASQPLVISGDLKEKLGIGEGDPFVYSFQLKCGSERSYFPREELVNVDVYSPWWSELSTGTWVTLVLLAATTLTSLTIYGLHPLLLLRIRDSTRRLPLGDVKLWGITVSDMVHLMNLLLIPILATRKRTLDAWVEKHKGVWKEKGFLAEPTVRRSDGFVALPCRLNDRTNGELVSEPGPDLLLRLWTRSLPLVEIIGLGGAGKTMLSVQLCRWAIDRAAGETQPCRLPLLVEEDTTDLMASIKRQLLAVLEEELEEDFIKALVKHGRLLLVFDRLSERAETTFEYVEKLRGVLAFGAAVVTTRREGHYQGCGTQKIYPMSLKSDSMLFFMSGLIKQQTQQLFETMQKQVELAAKLAQMITLGDEEVPVTALLVRIFVTLASELIEQGTGIDALPASVPEAYFRYLKGLNPLDISAKHYLSHEDMLRSARAIAAEALDVDFVPKAVSKDTARSLLSKLRADWGDPNELDPIERLKLNGVLREDSRGTMRDYLEFHLDPIAEYLAADECIHRCDGDSNKINELLESVRKQGQRAKGFVVALEVTLATLNRTVPLRTCETGG